MTRIIPILILFGLSISLTAGDANLKKGTFKAPINGVEIAYLVAGEGPPLMVMPNSWGIEKESLQALFSSLEAHFQMIYFDARGMGDSSTDSVENYGTATIRKDYDALRRYLKLDKVYLLGWSAGAMNGFLYAGEHSDHLHGAILAHGSAHTDAASSEKMMASHGEFFQKLGQKFGELTQSEASDADKNESIKRFLVDYWLPYIAGDREKGKAMIKDKLESGNYSWKHMQHMAADLQGFDARTAFAKITCPVLVVAGEKDIVAPELLKRDAEGIAKGRYVNFPNSGHYAMLEEPEAFIATVLAWRSE